MIKSIVLAFISIILFASLNACHQDVVTPEDNIHNEIDITIYSYLSIKGNPDMIKDCTPEMTIFTEKENTLSMSFSGNGEEWSEWVDYSENYDQFNVASGFNGTAMESALKIIYVRFKDADDLIFPETLQEPVYCAFEYEIQKLFSIKIEPTEAQIKVRGSQAFMVRGYDLQLNEVPLDPTRVNWKKNCDIGELSPITGLQTTYTAPEFPGVRNISAHYGSLGTGAKIYVSNDYN